MPGGRTALSTDDTARFRAVADLLAARALRDFGDGFVAVLLPVHLIALGFSPLEIGAIATAALLGSALLTLGIGMIGVIVAILGALVMLSIDNGLGLLGLSSGTKFVVTGGVLLLAVTVDSISRRGRAQSGRA